MSQAQSSMLMVEPSEVSSMKKKRILICGASGFIGRNLFDNLSKRKDLDVWGTYFRHKFSSPKLIRVDLTRKSSVMSLLAGFDVVIQAAAVTSGAKDTVERPFIHITDNLIMNSLVLEAAYKNKVNHFIFLSCTVMYPVNTGRAVREADLDLNEKIYGKYFGGGWMKVYSEKLCEFYSRISDMDFTVIRHSNIYGPWDKFDLEKSHVFGATVTKVMKAKNGQPIEVWGDGSDERDLLYIDDLVDFVEQSLKRSKFKYEIFNVGLGKSISIRELVEKIIAASGKQLKIKFSKSKPTIGTKLTISISKAHKLVDWQPRVDIDNGIKRTLSWYKIHFGES